MCCPSRSMADSYKCMTKTTTIKKKKQNLKQKQAQMKLEEVEEKYNK